MTSAYLTVALTSHELMGVLRMDECSSLINVLAEYDRLIMMKRNNKLNIDKISDRKPKLIQISYTN